MAFISVLSFTVMRLLVVTGLIPFSPELSLLPLLSIFMFSPLMLLGLVDRTRQLQEEITRVRAESAAQLRFLAQMSHELRSPLDIVLGNAQLLSREARSREQVSGLNSIFDSGRQLLLSLARLDKARQLQHERERRGHACTLLDCLQFGALPLFFGLTLFLQPLLTEFFLLRSLLLLLLLQ